MLFHLALTFLLTASAQSEASIQANEDVVWTTPSADALGSMPLGNGDIGVNAWMQADGELVFYISKTDSWSENGRLLKVGRLRVRMDPPLNTNEGFEQRLALQEGAMIVRCGSGVNETTTRLWVDANHPQIHITVDGQIQRTATAQIDLWRTERTEYPEAEVSDLLEDRSKPNRLHQAVFVEPDQLIEDLDQQIGWYHFNQKSVGLTLNAELQGLSDFFADKTDPLLGRIFGAVVSAENGKRLDSKHLISPLNKSHRFSVTVKTEHPSTPERWLANLNSEAQNIQTSDFVQRRRAHEKWWSAFWQRSWIRLAQNSNSDPIPSNSHSVRVAMDQHGSNQFVGEITDLKISAFPSNDAKESPADANSGKLYFESTSSEAGPINDSANWKFRDGLKIVAKLKAGNLPGGGGRIIDKTTPGGSDGFLFDTYPGRSLRFIVGSQVISATDVLPLNQWVEVSATLNPKTGSLAIHLNGRLVASSESENEGGNTNDASTVARAYKLQRWVDACAGRGRYPIKFNGSIFTAPHPGKFGDADYRRWGPGYWWQNTRLPYLSMCASGDSEMMMPLFRMYAQEQMELHKFRTQKYTGHAGAFIPECLYFWGPTFTATYGWTPFAERGEDKLQESGYHKWEWVSGLELVWMMLDYAEHTEDAAFTKELLIPTAYQILTFFEEHSPLDENGKLVMSPSQALETWWKCTNPMPELAGLRAVTKRLLTIPDVLTSDEDRQFWQRVLRMTPPLPTTSVDGIEMLAPAEIFAENRNVENPELYAVFPFRLVSFEKDNIDLGLRALEKRLHRGASGWRQDDLFMTHLGLAEQARSNLVSRARSKHTESRFPVFWGPNYDWVPDQDHGGVMMRTLQTMLMQSEGRKIFLLPAWPKEWDADFKLHAPYNTTLTGQVRSGKLVDLQVHPKSRQADLVIVKN